MKVKKQLGTVEVDKIKGLTSQQLADRCPDLRQAFPILPCTNFGCEFAVREPGYMNCTFVAAEAGGEHTLDAIGEMMGLTREGVRVIEVRALKKLRERLQQFQDHGITTLHQPHGSPRADLVAPRDEAAQPKNQPHDVPAFDDGKLVQLRRRAARS